MSYRVSHSKVRIVATKAALTFVSSVQREHVVLYTDDHEWNMWASDRSRPILHIEVRLSILKNNTLPFYYQNSQLKIRKFFALVKYP